MSAKYLVYTPHSQQVETAESLADLAQTVGDSAHADESVLYVRFNTVPFNSKQEQNLDLALRWILFFLNQWEDLRQPEKVLLPRMRQTAQDALNGRAPQPFTNVLSATEGVS